MKRNEVKTDNWKKIWHRLGIGLCTLSLVGFTACSDGAGDQNTGEEIADTELAEEAEGMGMGEDMYDAERFSTSYTETKNFGKWDANTDGFLDENEFNEGSYNMWDTDRDGMIGENEWNQNSQAFGMKDQEWGAWDSNRDNKLDKNEFQTAYKNNNAYSTWDRDRNSQLTERELSDGFFGAWDDNGDGMLERDRYDTYSNTYFND